MNINYIILTNNPKVDDLITNKTNYQLLFIDGTIEDVIEKCEELFFAGKCVLAADPMAGRNARPFPYLTIILQESDGDAGIYDWNKLADFAALHSKRVEESLSCSERIKNDYGILDRSFTEAALKL